jgi:hypothetical protein
LTIALFICHVGRQAADERLKIGSEPGDDWLWAKFHVDIDHLWLALDATVAITIPIAGYSYSSMR